MALIRPGSLAGQVSGSIGNVVFSHGRYGAYCRVRTAPTLVQNAHTMAARGRLAAASQRWGTLTADQQRAWNTFAETHPITNRIGDRQILSGHAAYAQINTRIDLAAGTPISVPPTDTAPAALATMALTYDIGAGDVELAFTATPLGATECLYIQAAVLTRPGQNYLKNRWKLVKVTAAAQATDLDISADVEARFGPVQVGHRVAVLVSVLDKATGLLSGPRTATATVVSTS